MELQNCSLLKVTEHEHAHRKIFEYIEIFYNRERLHSSLGNLFPIAFEAAEWAQAA